MINIILILVRLQLASKILHFPSRSIFQGDKKIPAMITVSLQRTAITFFGLELPPRGSDLLRHPLPNADDQPIIRQELERQGLCTVRSIYVQNSTLLFAKKPLTSTWNTLPPYLRDKINRCSSHRHVCSVSVEFANSICRLRILFSISACVTVYMLVPLSTRAPPSAIRQSETRVSERKRRADGGRGVNNSLSSAHLVVTVTVLLETNGQFLFLVRL